MVDRIHLVLDRAEKERFRAAAEREGKNLSAWLRDAAEERVAASQRARGLRTSEDMAAFFRRCDQRESGMEPDWEAHRKVIERSIRSGAGDS
ncbi:MAG: antitoxin [Longimicrobiales bacterium]